MPIYQGHKIHTKMMSTQIESFQKVAENPNLSKKDLRVFMFLCCRLESKYYKKIDKEKIAETLNLTKKEVNECLQTLMDEDILESGSDEHVSKGYRFSYADKEGKSKFCGDFINE